jgi:hypothetical protein
MIVPRRKKGLSCSLGQFKLLPMNMNVLWGKRQLPRGQCTFFKERPKFLNETYVLKHFIITIISYLLLYELATYRWKALKGNYNLVVGSISIISHIQKLCSHKVFNTFVPWGNMIAPQGNESPWGPTMCMGEKPKLCFPGSNHVQNFIWS